MSFKKIEVSTEVFAAIWSARTNGENTEDTVLRRVLGLPQLPVLSVENKRGPQSADLRPVSPKVRIRWVDDVESALINLGGRAHLDKIYAEVRRIRSTSGRSIPISFEEVIRKELEVHSSDSHAYGWREDIFAIEEKGSGVWRLRKGESYEPSH